MSEPNITAIDPEKLGDTLKRLRTVVSGRQLTLSAIADEAGIPLTTLDRIYRSQNYVSRLKDQVGRITDIADAISELLPEHARSPDPVPPSSAA